MTWFKKAYNSTVMLIPYHKATQELFKNMPAQWNVEPEFSADESQIIIHFDPQFRSALDQYLVSNGIYADPGKY